MSDDTSQEETPSEEISAEDNGTPSQEPEQGTPSILDANEPKKVSDLDPEERLQGAVKRITEQNNTIKTLKEQQEEMAKKLQELTASKQQEDKEREIKIAAAAFVADKRDEVSKNLELKAELDAILSEALETGMKPESLNRNLNNAYKAFQAEKGAKAFASNILGEEKEKQAASIQTGAAAISQEEEPEMITPENASKLTAQQIKALADKARGIR